MKPVHAILIALGALIVGALAGYFAGYAASGPGPAITVGGIEDPQPEARTPGTQDNDTDEPGTDTSPVYSAAENSPRERPARGGLAAWLAQNSRHKAARGTGRIHGKVLAPGGAGMAGATVKIVAQRRESPDDYMPDAPLEQQLEAQVRQAIFADSSRATAVTDAEGRYEFTGLGDYDYRVSAEVRGHYLTITTPLARYGTARPPAEVNFSAKQACEVEIDVLMPDGSRAKTARLAYGANAGGSGGRQWYAENPYVLLNPGVYEIFATRGENDELASDTLELDLSLDKPAERAVLQLKPMASIICTVKMPEGSGESSPMTRLRVILDPTPPPGAPELAPSGGDTRSEDMWRSGGLEHVFNRLAPGTHRLILAQGNRVIAWKDVAVTAGVVRETLAPPEPQAADYLIVRVLYHDGRPATGGSVRAEIIPESGERGRRASMGSVLSRPDGCYWVERPRGGDLTGKWKYQLSGEAPEYGSFTHEHPGDGPGEVTINLPAPASLMVYLTGAMAHPRRQDIHVQLNLQTGPGRWSGVQTPGNSRIRDSVRWSPLAPGTYRLTLRLSRRESDDGMPWNSELLAATFEVRPGENTQTVAVPLVHKLTLLIADPKSVRNLQLSRADGSSRRPMFGAQVSERTVIDGLAAGDWIISSGNEAMRVNLNMDLEVTFAPKPFDCVILEITPGGKIEAMGLRSGDKVIRVDGEDGATGAEIQRLMGESYNREATTWTVQRPGGTVNVTFNGQELSKAMRGSGAERENFGMRPSIRD